MKKHKNADVGDNIKNEKQNKHQVKIKKKQKRSKGPLKIKLVYRGYKPI